MAEEDLIFGKNRHFFGGIEPSNMRKFTASYHSGAVKLECQLPYETTINGQTLCSVAGAVIRKKSIGYPTDEFDGELVADIKSSTDIIDRDVSIGNVYYYAAFPYTGQGVYNRSPSNRTMYNYDSDHYVYGYDLQLDDSNPDTRVSYPPEVMNYGYTPAKVVNTSGYPFSYGSWPSTHGNSFMPRPCMLNFDGTIRHYLDPNDYTKQYNSSSSSDVANLEATANAMMEWPKIYIHREVVSGVYKFRCSDIKQGSDWDCWCNYDVNNNVIDHFYTGIYPGVYHYDGTTKRFRSISGGTTSDAKTLYSSSGVNSFYKVYSTYIRNNNPSGKNIWTAETLSDRMLIQDLLIMMAKSTNFRWTYGIATSGMSGIATGSSDTKGLFKGALGSGYDGPKVFGMENWWGGPARLIDGLLGNNYTMYYKLTPGTHDGTTTTDFSSSSYASTFKSIAASSKNGFISGMEFVSPYGRLYPNETNGSSSTYEAGYALIGFTDDADSGTVFFTGNHKPTGSEGISNPFTICYSGRSTNMGSTSYGENYSSTCATLSCRPIKS